jgi:hypothetical protein
MIAWMLYTVVITIVIAAAARAVETFARAFGYRLRWIWIGAIVLGTSLAATSAVRHARDVSSPAIMIPDVPELGGTTLQRGAIERARVVIAAVGRLLDAPMRSAVGALDARSSSRLSSYALVAWMVASLGIGGLFVTIARRFARIRATWPLRRLGEVEVRVAPEIGPVALGILRPEIVVPRWLLDRCAEEQGLAVAHEQEHLRARDPLLLALGWIAVIGAPWNAALWYMMSRLRLAIEVDCDARILRRGASAHTYGTLLIEVARSATPLTLGALTLAGSSHLHERIIMLRPGLTSFRRLRAAVAVPCATVGLLVACQATVPATRPVARPIARPSTVTFSRVATAPTVATPRARQRDTIDVRRKPLSAEPRADSVWVTRSDSVAIVPDSGAAPASREPLASQPTIFIDGVRSSWERMRALDRTRIDNVEVLKGAAAIREYGEDARNGIILITTKNHSK